ncbi:helix-turn-helix domain-containing protein [Mariniflexile litorale]|uniref:Helix-turn-helix domain-containing protein n=1 Tax=Mariniflexile litorale TaxID=3045158 RepID=A0AAU7EEE3_9FLAO|nr:helix-turn-helix domain-containing protein [Mariniflexile sp. KMM 9835]MDQ8213294.1 helix-turn-helix domain-containing protein [Mariniflexile sp. KMM 9835]
MNYQEYIPNSNIQGVVEKFWIVSDIKESYRERIFPEGCTNLLFNISDTNSSLDILGINSIFSDFTPNPSDYYFGVSFKPGMLGALTKESLFLIKNQSIPSQEIIPQFDNNILEKFIDLQTAKKRIVFVENQLNKVINLNLNDTQLTNSVANSIKSNYIQGTKNLAKNHNISLRQLERKFKNEVGISMKLYARLMRFNKALTIIKSYPNRSLSEIAYDLGFYDHSHLTNEIKHFTGLQPSLFR